jgi:hypothetical protein
VVVKYDSRMKVCRASDGWILLAMALVIERGSRSEASAYVTGTNTAIDSITQGSPRAFNRKTENLWRPGVDALGVLAWGWFAVTAILVGLSVGTVPMVLGHGVSSATVIGLLLAPSTALCLSRAMARQLLVRVLKSRRIDERTPLRTRRFLSDSVVVLLAVFAWCGWAVMLSL